MIVINPYVYAGVNFGSSKKEVLRIYGEPKLISTNYSKEDVFLYRDMSYTFSQTGVSECSFFHTSSVKLLDIDIYGDKDSFNKLCLIDNSPMEFLGFIILLNIGISLTGFHDLDDSQKSVVAFERGRWDRFSDKMVSYKV